MMPVMAHGATTAVSVAGAGIYELLRQVPYLALVGFLLLLVGHTLATHGANTIASIFLRVGLDIGEVQAILGVAVTTTLVLGIVSLFVSFLSRGMLREFFCRRARGCCLGMLQCCIANLLPRVLTLLSFLALVLLLALLVAYTVLLIVFVIATVLCSVAQGLAETLLASVSTAIPILDRTSVANVAGAVVDIDDAQVAAFCADSEGATFTSIRLLVGTFIAILGQVFLLMSLNSSLAFIVMERRLSAAHQEHAKRAEHAQKDAPEHVPHSDGPIKAEAASSHDELEVVIDRHVDSGPLHSAREA